MKVVVLVWPDAVVNDVTLVLSGRWSGNGLVIWLVLKMSNIVWNEAM